MPQGTVEFRCKVCGTQVAIPWGRSLRVVETQCSYGCYEIYPGVLAWDGKSEKIRILKAAAVPLMKKYRTYDRLVAECHAILVGETIHITATIKDGPEPPKPSSTKGSAKKIPTKV
jgi:hypothetical protein